MVLVDTSVWINWLRRGRRPATRLLDKLVDEEALLLAPVVLQELLQGARGKEELDELRQHFAGIPCSCPP